MNKRQKKVMTKVGLRGDNGIEIIGHVIWNWDHFPFRADKRLPKRLQRWCQAIIAENKNAVPEFKSFWDNLIQNE